ncbi:serine/threonine-protein phosphatase 2A 65 kDa regulatory subunit A beta isoform-like [Vicia villosa]|uniref:serine/threonine-protein phosphatase 2A 65 kDa regulatory subunit A beta isoform-like n=1 Tax=Vicia villosa TaxID=3911 RepID=UPI00273B159E|nr:serine/threonine-protein phosphatase 2A 65 kDa regulatory subunit A beta isoform-like [Vicia villosa]
MVYIFDPNRRYETVKLIESQSSASPNSAVSQICKTVINGTSSHSLGDNIVEHASALLPPLEAFNSVEETCVRDNAVDLLCRIGSQMRESDLVEYFIPLVNRLAVGEWFTARVYACGLFHNAYLTAPEAIKTELRSIYIQLSQDDMPMDKLWRVCYMVANQLYELCKVVGPEPTESGLVPAYVRLLQDNEAEVRIATAGKVTKFCQILSPVEATLDAVESPYMRKLIFQILKFVLQIISDNLLFKQWDPGTISLLSY